MGALLLERLGQHARQRGQATALVYGDARLRYAELWDQVRRLAAWYRCRGLRPGERVAVLMHNRPEYVVAYYAAWAAGLVAVGLNAACRAGELLHCLQHSGARLLVAEGAHRALPELGRRWLGDMLLTAPARVTSVPWHDALATEPATPSAPAPDALAALVYTSGTTGPPKGVMLGHGAFAANADAIVQSLRLRPTDKALALLPLHYAYGGSVMHSHLAVGAGLLLESSLVYPREVLARMEREGVTGLPAVAPTLSLLLSPARLHEFPLGHLRYITHAGGPIAWASVRRIRAALPHAAFYLMYGQTEATARLCCLPPGQIDEKPGAVGYPVSGVRLGIRDQAGRALPPGEVGEIWASGANIMLGYWGDPRGSAQVLRGGWLRTGDLGHMDDDGCLYLDGRVGDIIKTGAHRVSPVEIESVIGQIDGVEEVCVSAVGDDLLGQVIHARIVPRPGARLQAGRIRGHCRSRLASYKVPRQVEFCQALPRSNGGKVLRSSGEIRP
ncbi:class I adenylate-forming enzyme family protein [Alkalilimnicola sp. S0819]|uniref:class I adenylate-forming enzyme family protein n=1 Tax=Alkalilimnicola sp. S0819 TaxID=2613922 RepID=UPI001261E01B|nr:AMP-binding protein [Alkalilimnicola sp. S0819]KAB7622850.1 long-chain fatty acid--CoA ligase [Alkalilimnicola sp. S0819]MPQ17172.1 AMP-binding protein [Alkalilimnicola sp. S0819]